MAAFRPLWTAPSGALQRIERALAARKPATAAATRNSGRKVREVVAELDQLIKEAAA